MAAITDLAAASSVAAGDNLVINQSGTDRKVTADKFAIVGAANTVAAAQTMAQIKPTTVSLANNATQALGGVAGLALVQNLGTGTQALLWLSTPNTSIISQVGTGFSTTQGTANKTNVYFSGGVAYVENKTGSTCTVVYLTLAW